MGHFKETRVWFMRHGRPAFDYENCTYDEFIKMLSDSFHMPLIDDHGIDFVSLPQNVELICNSPARRAEETTEKLRENLKIVSVKRLEVLREVKFDEDIISRHEYVSIKDSREIILTRWFKNKNKSERFEKSIARARRIELFLRNRPEKTIILVTHGLFLRLLELYFVQGKRERITLSDLLSVKPIKLGQFVEVTLKLGRSPVY